MKSTLKLAILGLFLLFLIPSAVLAELTLRGESTYRYWGFKVYSARLYTPPEVKDIPSTLGQFRVRLSLTYARDLLASDFQKSGEAFIRSNPTVSFADISDELTRMNALYSDVKEGDTYTIDFVPGEGLTLSLNGEEVGRVPGDDFARAYLGIWLSEHSLSEDFTERLLGVSTM